MQNTRPAEPYQPGVGDLVRVAPPASPDACEDCPHFPGEEGQIGRVVRNAAGHGMASHPYLVLFAAPCAIESRHAGRLIIRARHYAAAELRPVDTSP